MKYIALVRLVINSVRRIKEMSEPLLASVVSKKRQIYDESPDSGLIESKKSKQDEENKISTVPNSTFERNKRKKVAVLFGYNGKGYYGMQRNPGVKTIEDDLLSAMLKADVINEENVKTPQSMGFQRAARTDKGVSAAQQVISLRLGQFSNIIEKINNYLPEQIRIFAVIRTTKGFNSKITCDARTYSYTLPTFAFSPPETIVNEDFRITDDLLKQVDSILSVYKGTHNFHNFTSGRKPNDASAQRYIIEFKCGVPFERDGIEFVTVKVKGQSFMLHQIRKMIGLAIAICRGMATTDTIEKAWKELKVDVPIAPSVGLVLEEVHYEKYDERYGNDGLHQSLSWEAYKDVVAKFKENYIYPTIIQAEKDEKVMLNWLSTLMLHTYDVREAGPPGSPWQPSQLRSEYGHALFAVQLADKPDAEVPAEDASSPHPTLPVPPEPELQSQ